GVNISPEDRVKNLSVAEQQFVEIAKALSYGSDLIIMDEPSATLTPEEVNKLFELISNLKKEGVSIVYISHKIEEIMKIGDRVTVLRDGEKIGTEKVENMDREKIIKWMVGRPLKESFPERFKKNTDIVLKVNNLSRKGILHDLNFSLHKGEIIGIAGLVGAGRTELVRAIYGADSKDSGEIKVFGKNVSIYSPKDALEAGIGLLPEDRKQQGLILEQSLRKNITLPDLDKVSNKLFIDFEKENKEIEKYIKKLNIKTASNNSLVKALSGGNQQKVVIAKLLYTDVDILLFDEPTRGIDVGAKREIYKLMDELTKEGKSIIMISSELPEVLGMSDRVLVMNEGHITDIYNCQGLTQEKVIKSATKEVK
ncbi:MAG: sugar ABC transporter ATP-binding protein, partial [bacterium]